MSYPQLCTWILFKKKPDGMYAVRNCSTDRDYTLGSTIAYFARRLDGKTDPFSILPGLPREDVEQMLQDLDNVAFLRYGRVLDKSRGSLMYSLIIPRKCKTDSPIPILLNYLLMLLWLPVFLFGLVWFFTHPPYLEHGSLLMGQLFALLIGTVFHEAAHACAGLCYGARVFEAGFLFHNYMPGFYVMIDDLSVKNRLRRVQILLAGVEMNVLLAGVGLLLSACIPSQSFFFFGFAIVNCVLGLTNLVFYDGLDGMSAMGLLLGTEPTIPLAKYTLKTRAERQRLAAAGPHGIIELLIICAMLVSHLVFSPLILFLTILEVVECFR